MRAPRLIIPPEMSRPSTWAVPSVVTVDEFADRLGELPLSAWLAAGREALEPNTAAERGARCAILEATISDRGLAVAAWYVCDTIDTAAYYGLAPLRRRGAVERRSFAAAHAAARDAALAILARRHLGPEDFAALTAPFEQLIRGAATTNRSMRASRTTSARDFD